MNRHIMRLCSLLAGCMLLLLGSCSPSSADEPQPEPGIDVSCLMGLYVNLGSREAAHSRAGMPSGPSYESGEGYENYIDRNDFRVYLFSTDNRLMAQLSDPDIAEVTEFDFTPVGESGTSVYRIMFRVDKIIENAYEGTHSFKIVMLANWGSYPLRDTLIPGVTTIADITEGADACGMFVEAPLNADNRVPFYGVQQYDNIRFTPGNKDMQKDPLLLLRAFAKIDVYDHQSTSKPIKKVTLTRHNTRYYKAPLGIFHNDQYTVYGYDNDFVTNLSLPENPYEWETDELLELGRWDDGHFVAYVPEFRNTDRGTNEPASLIVDYGDGNEYRLDFKYYDNAPSGSAVGDSYDIRRNYWYKFVVNRHSSDVTLTADVIPYLPIELKPGFGM